jgi:hypothetical protein
VLRSRLPDPMDEDGSSMVEVMVGLAMGMLVLAGVSMLLIVTLHGNGRISARAEASDNARVTMTRIMEELHSACVEPTIAPVQPKSTHTELIFKRGSYGGAAAASPTVTTATIYYREGTLWERDEQSGKPTVPRTLLSNVSPIPGQAIFTYENSTVPKGKPFEFTQTLGTEYASKTILVRVAFSASPKSEPVADAGAATQVENSATLRLTPPTYEEAKEAKPCE